MAVCDWADWGDGPGLSGCYDVNVRSHLPNPSHFHSKSPPSSLSHLSRSRLSALLLTRQSEKDEILIPSSAHSEIWNINHRVQLHHNTLSAHPDTWSWSRDWWTWECPDHWHWPQLRSGTQCLSAEMLSVSSIPFNPIWTVLGKSLPPGHFSDLMGTLFDQLLMGQIRPKFKNVSTHLI